MVREPLALPCFALLLCFSLQAHAQLGVVSGALNLASIALKVEQIAKQVQAVLQPPDLKIEPSDLPAKRPPPNTDEGWSFCDYSCASSYSVQAGNMGSTGVLSLEVSFKPLKNITSASMVWLMQNLHKDAVYYRDNQTYPMYQLLHGVDHCTKHDATPSTRVRVGTKFTWCEIPLTGCQYQQDSATEPWVCPMDRAGFVSSDNSTKWQALFQTRLKSNYAMVVTWFNSSGIEFVNQISLLPPPVTIKRTYAATRLTWQDSEDGLLLTVRTLIGLMKDNSNSEFDSSPLAKFYNRILKEGYLPVTVTNVPSQNITAVGYLDVLHFLHEYGNIPLWLPEVYQDAMDAAAAQAAADAAAKAAAAAGRAAATAARQAALQARSEQVAANRAQRQAELRSRRAAILAARQNTPCHGESCE